MDNLLVDVGNTTVDIRLWNSQTNNLKKIIRVDINLKTRNNVYILNKYFKKENIKFEKIIFSSVVPKWNELLYKIAKKNKVKIFNIKTDFLINKENFLIDNFDQLGADFICNYLAIKNNYLFDNLIIVSMGTASTLSIIKNNKFEGAIICPGLINSLQKLISSAALLKNYNFSKTEKEYGKNTIDAINVGSYNSHFLMLLTLIKNLNINNVIFTGGNAKTFIQEIEKNNFIYDEELIFKGMINLIK